MFERELFRVLAKRELVRVVTREKILEGRVDKPGIPVLERDRMKT
jgi:hypothetical protein